MRGDLPTGTITFLFSDIEGSTRLATALGTGYAPVLERHQALLRVAFDAAGGVEVGTEGDSFFVVFQSAEQAVAAAAVAQRALADESHKDGTVAVRVRMGLHTGAGVLGGDNYVGLDVHRAARISAAAHGGEVLLSGPTRALVERALPAGLSLRDLGQFRLKDLERPETLVQLVIAGLPADFPPPRSLEAPSNLPLESTSFIGRQHEVDQLTSLLAGTRLLTLTGPGGTGKTRLSLRVAQVVRDVYPDGTFFVGLDEIRDPALIPAAIAEAMQVREDPERPILDVVKERLRDQRLLLVLDNFEQLAPGAAIISDLLAGSPGLKVLTSSREVLHLRGEQEYAVPPLGVPDIAHLPALAELSQYDAVALFIKRATEVRPEFSVTNENAAAVAAICARLDGLPLAIELAAARIKLFTPDALLARLDRSLAMLTGGARDVPARQQTLRGAVEWSYNLLTEVERTLFRRLAVFHGGWTIDASQSVCDPGRELAPDMVEVLLSFVDKSLVRRDDVDLGEPRFRMLETIREYAAERLDDAADSESVHARHAEFVAELLGSDDFERLGSAEQAAWLQRMELERENIRAALAWAPDHGQATLALRTAGSLWRFWEKRGHIAEGRAELASLLAHPAAAAPTRERAAALGGLGGLEYWQGDLESARQAYQEAITIRQALDDPAALADALYNLGFAEMMTGHLDAARTLYADSFAVYDGLGDRTGTAKVSEAQVLVGVLQHDYAAALAAEEQNVLVFRQLGNQFRVSTALTLIGLLRIHLGGFVEARAALTEAMSMFRTAGDMPGIVNTLLIAAHGLIVEGRAADAAVVSGAADALSEPLGEVASGLDLAGIAKPATEARQVLGDSAYEAAAERGRSLDLDTIVKLAFGSPGIHSRRLVAEGGFEPPTKGL